METPKLAELDYDGTRFWVEELSRLYVNRCKCKNKHTKACIKKTELAKKENQKHERLSTQEVK